MRKKYLYKFCFALAVGIIGLSSCISEPKFVLPPTEISILNGSEDYFVKSMDFTWEGGEKRLAFSTNLKWEMKMSTPQNGVQWLTLDRDKGNSGNNTVVFTAQENTTYEDRSVLVQLMVGDTICNIRVNQKRLDAITLTSNKFEVSSAGGSIDIKVNYSMDYTFTIPDDYKGWIHPSTNKTRGLETSWLTFTIDPSDEYEKREGRIYFSAGDQEEIVTIYQAGSGKLVLSQDEYNLSGAEQAFSVDVSSNFDFTLEMPEVDWLKQDVSQTRGMSSHTLNFKVTKNEDYDSRSAKIKLSDKNSKLSETIVVNQASLGAVLIIAQKEYHVGFENNNLDVEVSSNFDYNIDFQGANWVKQRKSSTRGITSRLLQLTINENTSKDPRTATIKLYDKNSDVAETITITQDAKGEITIPTKEYTVDELGGLLTIEINSNVDYKFTINADWIKPLPNTTRSLTSHKHQLSIDALGDADDREGTITISNDDLQYSNTITIKQRNTFYFENKSIDILIGREKALSVKNTTKQSVEWSSSNTSIATVTNNGNVKGIKKGTATITAKTTDGKHVATCKVNICELTDMITIKSGGSVSKEGNLVKKGSQIKWAIKNNSPVKVTLESMQLVGSSDGETGNEYHTNEDIASGSTVTKTTTIDTESGYHLPITCRFVFVYNGEKHRLDAKYE